MNTRKEEFLSGCPRENAIHSYSYCRLGGRGDPRARVGSLDGQRRLRRRAARRGRSVAADRVLQLIAPMRFGIRRSWSTPTLPPTGPFRGVLADVRRVRCRAPRRRDRPGDRDGSHGVPPEEPLPRRRQGRDGPGPSRVSPSRTHSTPPKRSHPGKSSRRRASPTAVSGSPVRSGTPTTRRAARPSS